MFIFTLILKADKICIYNLAGEPEIWVSPDILTRDKDRVLKYLRRKLEDESITTLIQQRGEYMIIRHPDREYLIFGTVPPNPDDTLLYDDYFFVIKLMDQCSNNNAKLLYNNLSDRLKKDINLLFRYLKPDIYDRFPILSLDKEMVIKMLKRCEDKKFYFRSSDIFIYLSEHMRNDLDIIKIMLSNPIFGFERDAEFCCCVPHIFEYNFIIKNFSNAYIIPIYLWMDDYTSFNYSYFDSMDGYKRAKLLKMALIFTMIRPDNHSILSKIYDTTKRYIWYIHTFTRESDWKHLKPLEDILKSSIFYFKRSE